MICPNCGELTSDTATGHLCKKVTLYPSSIPATGGYIQPEHDRMSAALIDANLEIARLRTALAMATQENERLNKAMDLVFDQLDNTERERDEARAEREQYRTDYERILMTYSVAVEDLSALRARLATLEAERSAWRVLAEHRQWCRACTEGRCYEGQCLSDAARQAGTARPKEE